MKRQDWLTGPVVITGADGHVGRALQARLAELPNPVRGVSRSDDWTPAITEADAVVHLAGTLQPKRPNTYQAANVESVERMLEPVAGSAVQRIVFLSYVGADPDSDNEYLRTKGQAENLIQQNGVPSVILRSTFICGEPEDIGPSFASYQSDTGGTVSVLGDGTQKLAPIHVDDLTGLLIAAALDPSAPIGTFEVSGPEVFTLDRLVQWINPNDVKIRHLRATVAKLLARFTPQLTPALLDVLLSDSVARGDPVETASRFAVSLRRKSDRAGIRERWTS